MHEKKGKNSVFGIFKETQSLELAIDKLKSLNFRNSDISVLKQASNGEKNFIIEKHTKAPEGATTGATTGAIAGGAFGWLLGTGTIIIPGLGPFLAAGPILALIAGAGVGGTIGGIAGGLIGLGIPEFEAERLEGHIKEGGILLSVHVDNAMWEDKAKEILTECGAQNISVSSEKKNKRPVSYQDSIGIDYDDQVW